MGRSSSGRVAGLDGLRALAITGVILTHVLPNRVPGGQIGVDVFFALSGYLITSLLLRESERFGAIRLRDFYARRFLRLMPAYVVFLVGATALSLHYQAPHTWSDLVAAATYTADFHFAFTAPRGSYTGHSWSLSVEEQFYLLWPLTLTALLRARRVRLRTAVITLAVGFLALSAVLQLAGVSDATLFFLPTTRAPELLAGVLGAVLVQEGLPRGLERATVSTLVAAGALILVVAWMRHDTWDDPWSYRGGFTVVAILTVVVILHVEQRPDSLVSRALGWWPVALVGRRSYAAYLWHIPALIIADYTVTDRRELLALTVGLTAVATTLSWYLVEAPCLRLKSRFERVHLHDPGDDATLPALADVTPSTQRFPPASGSAGERAGVVSDISSAETG
jgi:peptidoglycan/LPS O-acetylase OafA/YrhL